MSKQPNYRKTLTACYLGLVTQAITANFAPLLFLIFHNTYGISLGQIALINIYNFSTCPIEPITAERESMGIRGLVRIPVFWLLALLMVCSGAAEISMAQWASSFAESGLGLSKAVGDLAGLRCLRS